MTGTLFGLLFVMTGRFRLPMAVHAAYDVVAVLLIYWGFEERVAHRILR